MVTNWDLELSPATQDHCTVVFYTGKWAQGEEAVDTMNGKRIKDTCQGREVVWTERQYGARLRVWRGS